MDGEKRQLGADSGNICGDYLKKNTLRTTTIEGEVESSLVHLGFTLDAMMLSQIRVEKVGKGT